MPIKNSEALFKQNHLGELQVKALEGKLRRNPIFFSFHDIMLKK